MYKVKKMQDAIARQGLPQGQFKKPRGYLVPSKATFLLSEVERFENRIQKDYFSNGQGPKNPQKK